MLSDLMAYAAPVAAWITGPMARAAAVLAGCLALVAVAHWMLRRLVRQWRQRPRGSGKLSRGDRLAMVVIIGLSGAFVLVAFTMSAAALHDSATWLQRTAIPINGGDLRFLFPLVLDGLIILFLALDLWTEWKSIRHPYYRWVAYSLSVLTLYLNVRHGGGGSLLGHAAPPLGVIVVSEGLAIWIRSLAGLIDTGRTADRIPMGHWIARPASAWRVWRLMLGWNIESYPQAVDMERKRSMAYAMLAEQHGPGWRSATPRHLRWMLDNGSELETAYAIIRAMTQASVAMSAEEVRAQAETASDRSFAAVEESALGVARPRPVTPPVQRPAIESAPAAERSDALSDAEIERFLAEHSRRSLTGSDQGNERTSESKRAKTPSAPSAPRPRPSSAPASSERERARQMWLADRSLSGAALARAVGKSAPTGSRWRREFEQQASERSEGGESAPAPDGTREWTPPPGVRIKRWKQAPK